MLKFQDNYTTLIETFEDFILLTFTIINNPKIRWIYQKKDGMIREKKEIWEGGISHEFTTGSGHAAQLCEYAAA